MNRVISYSLLGSLVLTVACGFQPLFAQVTKKSGQASKAVAPPPPSIPDDTFGQETTQDKKKAPDAGAKSTPAGPARAEFDKQMEQWKTLIKDIRQLKTEFQTAAEDKQPEFQKRFDELIAKGREMLPALREAALAAFKETGSADPQLERFLVKFVSDAVETDDFEVAGDLSKKLIDAGSTEKSLPAALGVASFVQNDYATAEGQLKVASESGALGLAGDIATLGGKFVVEVAGQKALWEKEVAIREAEAAKDDLPRVELTTNKGVIELELFENEAPDTVGNFISLVESGFYNDKTFHRVVPHFVAQGGDPKGDGTGGPGYQIYCECYKDDYRRHFRGSLSMAHAGRDTGGSQFFITFRPTPELDGKHTCFGRVVKGMEVLARLQRRDVTIAEIAEATPDKIITAKVLRKRDHAYVPKKVEQ